MEDITGIMTAIGAAIAFISMLIARWSETNPKKPWWVRAARVMDLSQIVDSTRRLGDE